MSIFSSFKKDFELVSNENLYLFSEDPKVIKKLELMSKINIKLTAFNKKIFKKAIINYRELIDLISNIIKEIGLLNNSISYSVILSKLIHKGSLSNDLKLTISENDEEFKDIIGFFGLDIINGYGCCRHFSNLFQDVFENIGMCGEMIICINKEGMTLEEAFSSRHNHVVNLIEFNNVYYAKDSLNANFYQFINGFAMNSYFDLTDYAYFKPSVTMIMNGKTLPEVKEKIKLFTESSKSTPLTIQELKEIILETIYLYNKNKNLIKDFERNSEVLKRKIVSNI